MLTLIAVPAILSPVLINSAEPGRRAEGAQGERAGAVDCRADVGGSGASLEGVLPMRGTGSEGRKSEVSDSGEVSGSGSLAASDTVSGEISGSGSLAASGGASGAGAGAGAGALAASDSASGGAGSGAGINDKGSASKSAAAPQKPEEASSTAERDAAQGGTKAATGSAERAQNGATSDTKSPSPAKSEDIKTGATSKDSKDGAGGASGVTTRNASGEDTLLHRVENIEKGMSEKDREADEQRSRERREAVELAVDAIRSGSKIYLPDSYGRNAAIIYFGVNLKKSRIPWHPVIEEPTDPDTLNTAQKEQAAVEQLARDFAKSQSISQEQALRNLSHIVDSVSGPTILALDPVAYYTEDGKAYRKQIITGDSAEHLSQLLEEETGAHRIRLMTAEIYPTEEMELYEFALKQKREKAMPELIDDVPLRLKDFATIYICYPVWWNDMPRPLYSMFERHDFSGQNIVPLCIGYESDCKDTVRKMSMLEPNAQIKKGFRFEQGELQDIGFKLRLRRLLEELSNTVVNYPSSRGDAHSGAVSSWGGPGASAKERASH